MPFSLAIKPSLEFAHQPLVVSRAPLGVAQNRNRDRDFAESARCAWAIRTEIRMMHLCQLAISLFKGFVAGLGANAQQFIQCFHRRLFTRRRQRAIPRQESKYISRPEEADYRPPGQ